MPAISRNRAGNGLNAAIGIVRLGGRASSATDGTPARPPAKYIFDKLMMKASTANTSSTCRAGDADFQHHDRPSGERTIVTFRDPQYGKSACPMPVH